jgi:hypothetical protein
VMRRDDDEESWPLDVFFEPNTAEMCKYRELPAGKTHFPHLRMAGSYMTRGGVWVI